MMKPVSGVRKILLIFESVLLEYIKFLASKRGLGPPC